jgi:hypothetical protein
LSYSPNYLPEEPQALVKALREELAQIAQALNAARPYIEFQVLHAEPKKVREGMEVEADGTDWNPGSGAGKYIYRSGAWTFIG